MTPIDSTNHQNKRSQCASNKKLKNFLIFTVILEIFAKFGGYRIELICKRMYGLVNVGIY